MPAVGWHRFSVYNPAASPLFRQSNLIDKTLGPYKVLELLGVGGLGAMVCALVLALPAASAQLQRPYAAARHGGNYMHNYYLPPAPSSTPWAPAWSPDGDWIAVAMSGSIWRIDPDTGIAEELSYNDSYHSSPDWSPDGRWIVYTADEDNRSI